MSSNTLPPSEGGEADDISQSSRVPPTSTSPTSPNQDADDANYQFEQQQTLITQLKEVLRKNEEKLSGKEKEVEEYATKLSIIKSRARNPLRSPRNDPTGGETPTSSKEKKGLDQGTPSKSLTLLRQKVNESRVIFEKRDREMNESKRGVEVMVEQLKAKLDERDNTIRELQTNLDSSASTIPSELNSSLMDEMPDQEQQLLYKDNKIIELTQLLSEQKAITMGLQENLLEKDSVIDARTKAIALMSEDLCRKGKATLDQLEETREEMRHMQNRFVVHEAQLKKEKDALNNQLESKEKRLRSLEDANKNLELIRVELNAQVLDLQERLDVERSEEKNKESQEDIEELRKSLSEMEVEVVSYKNERNEKEDEIKHLVERLKSFEAANKTLEEVHGKLNAQLAERQERLASEEIKQQSSDDVSDSQKLSLANKQVVKLKALTKKQLKQINSFKKMSDANSTILDLQNRIAELEEEKGNLQLHLVDFDELKVSESGLTQRTIDLEAQVATLEALCKQQSADLMASPTLDVERYQAQVEELREELIEMKASKVRAELKAVELEEDVDNVMKEKNVLADMLNQQTQTANQQIDVEHIKELKEYAEDLNVQLSQKSKMMESFEAQFSLLLGNGPLEIWVKQIEDFKHQLISLQDIVGENEKNATLKESVVQTLESDLTQLKIQLRSANDELAKNEAVFKDLSNSFSQMEKALKHKDDELHESLAKQTQQLENHKKLHAKLKAKQLQAKSFAEKINELQSSLIDKDSQLDEINAKKSEYVQNLELQLSNLVEINNQLQSTVENEVYGYQNKIIECGKLNECLEEENRRNVILLKDLTEQLSLISDTKQQLETVQSKELHDAHNYIAKLEAELSKHEGLLCDLESTHKLSATYLEEVDKQKELLAIYKTDVQKEITVYVEKIAELERQCADFSSLSETTSICQERVALLETELSQSRTDLFITEAKLQEKIADIVALEERCVEIKSNSDALAVCQNTISVLQNDLYQAQTALSLSEDKIIAQSSYMEGLRTSVVSMDTYSEALSIYKNNVAVLDSKLSNLHIALEMSETRVGQQNNEIDDLKMKCSTLDSLTVELEECRGKVVVLESNLLQVQTALTDSEVKVVEQSAWIDDLKTKCSTLDSCTEELKQCQEKVLVLESNLLRVQADLTDSEAKVVEQSAWIDDLKTKCSTLDSHSEALAQSKVNVTTMENDLSQAQSALISSEVKLQEQRAVTESLEEEIVKKNDRILRLETSLDDHEEKRNALEAVHDDLLLQLQEASQSHAQLAEKDCQLEHLSFELNYLKDKVHVLEEYRQGYSNTIEENKLYILEMENKLTSSQSALKSAQDEARRSSQFEQQFIKASEELDSLNNKLSQTVLIYEQRHAKVDDELQKCNTNLENLCTQFGELDSERRLLVEKCDKLLDEKLTVMTDLEESNTLLSENLIKIKELEEVICNLEYDLHSSQAFANDCYARNQSLKVALQEEVKLKQELLGKEKSVLEDCDARLSSILKKNKQLENLLCSIDGFKDLCENDVSNIIMLAQQRVEAMKQKHSETSAAEDQTEMDLLSAWTEEGDDGGCVWGSEEAKLEEAHQISSRQKEQDLAKQVSSLELIIEKLDMDKVQLTSELKISKVQCAKLVKRIRALCESHDKSVKGFQTLDQTMENEFVLQVSSLEKELITIKSENKALSIENTYLKNSVEALNWQISGFAEDKEKLSQSVNCSQKIVEDREKKIVELSLEIESLLQNVQFPQRSEGMPNPNEIEAADSAIIVVSPDAVEETVQMETSEMLQTLPPQLEDQKLHFEEREIKYQNDLVQLQNAYEELSLAYHQTHSNYVNTISELETFKSQNARQDSLTKESPSLQESDLNVLHGQLLEENRQTTELLKAKENEIELYKRYRLDLEQENREGKALLENIQTLLSSKEEAAQLQYTELRELQNTLSNKTSEIERLLAQLANEEFKLSELNERLIIKEQDVLHLMARLEIKNVEVEDMAKELQEHTKVIQLLKSVQDDQMSISKIPEIPVNPTSTAEPRNTSVDEDAQNELDHALYLLHQKEVRCDELTLELMQLLEERDTLQIRLSTSLRMIEEMKSSTSNSGNLIDTSIYSSQSEPSVELQVQTNEASTEAAADVLADKLDQLRNVGRQQRQMALQHQRASGAIDANYTVSRDAQSQSETLYNWIWGRSTPKVMDI